MNTEIIVQTARATLAGTISFPEVVGQLLAAGVEYYHVDYVGMRKTFYSADGDMVVTPITHEGLPPVAPEFSVEGLRANILDSQRNGQAYRDFTPAGNESRCAGLLRVPAWKAGRVLGTLWRSAYRVVSRRCPDQQRAVNVSWKD